MKKAAVVPTKTVNGLSWPPEGTTAVAATEWLESIGGPYMVQISTAGWKCTEDLKHLLSIEIVNRL